MPHELRSKPGHLVWRAYQLTWQIFAEEAGPLDITPVQEALLLVLSRRENLDQKTLAELVALDRSTAGNVIDRLEKRKLIARAENDKDRRARLVSLTARGKSLSEKLRPIAERAAERLLASLSPLERSEFIRLLRKITGLADPFDQATIAPPNVTRLSGKQILCVGLSDAFGQSIVQRLQSDGARVTKSPLPALKTRTDRFDESLKQIIQNDIWYRHAGERREFANGTCPCGPRPRVCPNSSACERALADTGASAAAFSRERLWTHNQSGVVPRRRYIGPAPCSYGGCKLIHYFSIEANSRRLPSP